MQNKLQAKDIKETVTAAKVLHVKYTPLAYSLECCSYGFI